MQNRSWATDLIVGQAAPYPIAARSFFARCAFLHSRRYAALSRSDKCVISREGVFSDQVHPNPPCLLAGGSAVRADQLGVEMKVALLSAPLLGSQLGMPVSDRLPKLNVDALCK